MRNYVFDARAPIVNASLVHEQLRLALAYQRTLIALERKRRALVDRIYRHAAPAEHAAVDELTAQLEASLDAIRLARGRQDEAAETEATARVRELRSALRPAYAALKAARKSCKEKVKPRLARMERGVLQRAKAIYKATSDGGLAWGTMGKVVEWVERAAQASAKVGSMPKMPRFSRLHADEQRDVPEGQLAVQIQAQPWVAVVDRPPPAGEPVTRRWLLRHAVAGKKAQMLAEVDGQPCSATTPGAVEYWRRDFFVGDAIACTDMRFRIEIVDDLGWRKAQGQDDEARIRRAAERVNQMVQALEAHLAADCVSDSLRSRREFLAHLLHNFRGKRAIDGLRGLRFSLENDAVRDGRRLTSGEELFRSMLLAHERHQRAQHTPPPLRNPLSKKSQKREAIGSQRAIVSLRIGSDNRKPIWASWPVYLHRPLPPNAPIKWVSMHARLVGLRLEWRLIVTVDDGSLPEREGGTVAVNLGWRRLPDDTLRVGYAVGDDGFQLDIRTPPETIERLAHAEELRSQRDRNRDLVIMRLLAYARGPSAPAGLRAAVEHAHQWRSREPLVALRARWDLARWPVQRFHVHGRHAWQTQLILDEVDLRAVLDGWAQQDEHLGQWEADDRRKAYLLRLDTYRKAAAQLARRYARVVVTKTNLRDFVEQESAEDGSRSDGRDSRKQRALAAPSEWRGALKNACSTRGTRYDEIAGRTDPCNVCGVVDEWDRAFCLHHTCSGCGNRWDQDENHCRNLLVVASGLVVTAEPGPLATSETQPATAPTAKRQSRWSKRRSQPPPQAAEVAGENS